MSDAWATAIAGLGGALLGGLITFSIEWWRTRKTDKSALDDRRSRAYAALLTRSVAIAQLASNLHIIMQYRSGIREDLNVTIGRRRPFDTIELTALTTTEIQPLYDAWSEVWMVGSEEAIAQANDMVAHCGKVISAATQRGAARPTWLSGIVGEKWTKTQLDTWQDEQQQLAEARKKFGEIVRKEIGLKAADLFASNEIKLPATQSTSHRLRKSP